MRRSVWGLRKVLTMMQKVFDQVLKEARRRSSSASTAVRGLTGMNGTIRSLMRGILFLNTELTFCAMRNALGRFLKSIKRNMQVPNEQGGPEKKEA